MGLLFLHLLLDCWCLSIPTPGLCALSNPPVLTTQLNQAPLNVYTQDLTLSRTRGTSKFSFVLKKQNFPHSLKILKDFDCLDIHL